MIVLLNCRKTSCPWRRLGVKGNIDSDRCGCVLIRTHDIPCGYELVKYDLSSITLNVVHVM